MPPPLEGRRTQASVGGYVALSREDTQRS